MKATIGYTLTTHEDSRDKEVTVRADSWDEILEVVKDLESNEHASILVKSIVIE